MNKPTILIVAIVIKLKKLSAVSGFSASVIGFELSGATGVSLTVNPLIASCNSFTASSIFACSVIFKLVLIASAFLIDSTRLLNNRYRVR